MKKSIGTKGSNKAFQHSSCFFNRFNLINNLRNHFQMKNRNILSMVFAIGALAPAAHVYAQCPSVTTSQTSVTCKGGSNGTATASVSGGTAPYTYSWSTSPVQTAATATGLTAGTYMVAVNDASPCPVIIDTITVTEPAFGVFVFTGANTISCNGGSDGSAMAFATDGIPPFTFSWNTTPVQTTSMATGLSAGTYVVIATSAVGCTGTDTVSLTEPAALTAGVTSTNASSCSASDGTATASVAGGTAPYTYSWSTAPVQTTATATGLTIGTYSVTTTDVNGCSLTATVTITCVSSVASLAVQNEFIISPNPTAGKIQVISNQYSVIGVEIYNLLGDKVYATSVIGHSASVIDISNHPEGIYFLNIKTAAASFTQKLIIQK